MKMRALIFGRGKFVNDYEEVVESTTTVPMSFSVGFPELTFRKTTYKTTTETGKFFDKCQSLIFFKKLILIDHSLSTLLATKLIINWQLESVLALESLP